MGSKQGNLAMLGEQFSGRVRVASEVAPSAACATESR
jgi:hypothetical protein